MNIASRSYVYDNPSLLSALKNFFIILISKDIRKC